MSFDSDPEDPRDRGDALVLQIEAAAHLLGVIGIFPAVLDEMPPQTLATTAFDIIEWRNELKRCLAAMTARERELTALAAQPRGAGRFAGGRLRLLSATRRYLNQLSTLRR